MPQAICSQAQEGGHAFYWPVGGRRDEESHSPQEPGHEARMGSPVGSLVDRREGINNTSNNSVAVTQRVLECWHFRVTGTLSFP